MPDFCGDGADFPGSGFCQLSGTQVMPDFCGGVAAFPGAAGTSVRTWQAGQGICRPAYCDSHSKGCPQCEQLNLSWLIKLPSLAGRKIGERGEIVQLRFPWPGVSPRVSPSPAQTGLLRGMGSWVLSLPFCGSLRVNLSQGGSEPEVGVAGYTVDIPRRRAQQVAPIG